MAKVNKVLLVDDDDVSNFLTKTMLEIKDFSENVDITLNGEHALNYFKQHCKKKEDCPEVILLDINMPVMNGFEFLDEFMKIKNRTQDISIVMLTSSSDPKDIKKAQTYNVKGYITKPFTVEKLEEILKTEKKE